MAQKRVGIIVPCFNQGQFAAECIRSLQAQTYQNWRAVLIDDASTDGISGRICEGLISDRVKVVRLKQNLGRSEVRNEGVRQLGNVDYILSVDCDDYLSSTYVAQLTSALDANRDAGLAYGVLHCFGEVRGVKTWPNKPLTYENLYLQNQLPGSGVMFRSHALSQTAGWRRDFSSVGREDYDIWLQVVERGWKPVWVKEAACHYRQHAQSFLATNGEDSLLISDVYILKYHLRSIQASIGVAGYLRHRLMPALLKALHELDVRRMQNLGWPLLRICPATSVRMMAEHYSCRLRDRFSPNSNRS
jgi:glycosyltransferase involved in cell wall biosynthesis